MMIRILKRLMLVTALCVLGTNAFSQSKLTKKADQYFANDAYPSAAKLYLLQLETEAFDQHACERLAKCYALTSQFEEAAKWYEKAIVGTQDADVAYSYAQVLKTKGDYALASKMFDRYGELSKNYEEARKQGEACDQAELLKGDGKGWKIDPTNLNTTASDFGPVFRGNELVFVSARRRGFFARFLNTRNDNLFYDIYKAPIQGPVTFGKVKLQKASLKTRFHDGPLVFSKDLNTAFVTRSNMKGGKLQRDAEKRAHLQLFSATLKKGKYKKATLLPFNSDVYSTGHPALSYDGMTMIFASDIPGGMGGSDLYICKKENGNWSSPQNMGAAINTSGDELFPSFTSTGMLWFASNGHLGLGGLDIFFASTDADGNYANVKNPGMPLNSAQDDFSICFDNRGQGYFASNRLGGKGDDDIYHFQRILPIEFIVTNSLTHEPVANAVVKMQSSTGSETILTTNADGKANSYLDWGKSYRFESSKTGYRQEMNMLDGNAEVSLGGTVVQIALYKYPTVTVDGRILAADKGNPINGAKVRVVGENREFPFVSDDKGKFTGKIDTSNVYTAIVEKTGFLPALYDFNTDNTEGDLLVPIDLNLKEGGYVLVEGSTVDKSSGQLLAGTHVRGIATNGDVTAGPSQSRRDGKYWLVLNRTTDADILASRDGYFTARIPMPANTALTKDSIAALKIELVPAKVGELVKIIYYDYRESVLTSKAKSNLDEIVFFLLDNPSAVVELSSHTDSRGSNEYNETLSNARAKAAVDYVISRGVGADRIQAKGYGESQLSNDCADEKDCTDEQHAANRRTEIRVTAIK